MNTYDHFFFIFCPKILKRRREVKNGPIMFKFTTLDWMTILRSFFLFFENLLWTLGTKSIYRIFKFIVGLTRESNCDLLYRLQIF